MFSSQLVVNGHCKQVDIVRVFGVSAISVKRSVKQYREGGVEAFFRKRKGGGKRVWTSERLNQAQALLNEGRSRQEVAEALAIKPDTLYRALRGGQLSASKKRRSRPPEVNEA
jgi:transposase